MSDQDILEVEYDLVISKPPGITFFKLDLYSNTKCFFNAGQRAAAFPFRLHATAQR